MYASLYYLIAIVLGFSLLCVLAIAIEITKRYAAYSKRGAEDDADSDSREENKDEE